MYGSHFGQNVERLSHTFLRAKHLSDAIEGCNPIQNLYLEPGLTQNVDIATHWLALPHQCKMSNKRRNQLNVSEEERLTDGSKTSEKVLKRNAALTSIYGAAQSAD